MKVLGQRHGKRVAEVRAAIEANAAAIAAAYPNLPRLTGSGGPIELAADDVVVTYVAPEGWSGTADRDTQVLIDLRITDELRREGLAREVVRQVQDLRKSARLEIEDRIALHLGTDSAALRQAIAAHRDYISAETLATQWAEQALNGDAAAANVTIDGQALTVQLRKAPV
jgi:isoleucyl-tRNA synthetase